MCVRNSPDSMGLRIDYNDVIGLSILVEIDGGCLSCAFENKQPVMRYDDPRLGGARSFCWAGVIDAFRAFSRLLSSKLSSPAV